MIDVIDKETARKRAQHIVRTWEKATPRLNDGTDWHELSDNWALHYYIDIDDEKLQINAKIYPVMCDNKVCNRVDTEHGIEVFDYEHVFVEGELQAQEIQNSV